MTTRASSSHGRLSVCMSSRDYPHINVDKCSEVRTDISNGQDIIRFVESELNPLFREEDEFKKEIIRKASGVFLWVVLVVNRLVDEKDKGQDKKTLQAVLKSLPIDLHDLFARCFENMDDPCATRTLMLWVLFAERSLAPAELECALNFSNEASHDSFPLRQGSVDDCGSYEQLRKRIKHLSKGLVEFQNVSIGTWDKFTFKVIAQPRVQLIHESARDFLLQYNGLRMIDNTLGTSPIPRSHDFLARACMRYLTMKEFQWFRENSHFDCERLISQRVIIKNELNNLRETYPLCEYAVQFMFKHASKAEKGGIFPVHLNHSFGGNQGQVFLTFMHINDIMNHISFDEIQGRETALMHVVAEHGILSCLVDLLNEGVPVNLNGGSFSNVLIAASWTGHPKMVQILLDRGADTNALNKLYGSALQAAAAQGHMDVIHILLKCGADINASGRNHGDALQAAAARGHRDIVKMLLDCGADVSASSGGGHNGNALTAAASEGHMDMVQTLLDRGADVSASSGGGHNGNALTAAASEGHMDVVQMLLDRGANVNALGAGGLDENALQAATSSGRTNIVQMLLDYGADINAEGGLCGSALQGAAYHGYSEIVRILLDRGPDITVQGGYYGTALEQAASEGYQDVVKMLEDHITKVNAESRVGLRRVGGVDGR
ncbi:hypothetical protein EPUS_05358 [Endocarpon pusillum Z07020]|uniref:Uncharacterized protein n=1 Tax=Endocarpon pusillum (strain Z07020 / HMAS-L-300199) TaxID=1263415 RepID=U1HTK5_ENDPU|nr:uncharacterized protein EPUS_05358 [Endocarpon pusillum Z07020]ERF73935.1 hypothetical protein EPUS_05358 [Endocarpon pusillum Z07020]